uniref:Hyaluronidase n=1 Tax=Neolamprologus brichardi TaxID=32507 RepID=A0A3Q4I5L4_NEOBR
ADLGAYLCQFTQIMMLWCHGRSIPLPLLAMQTFPPLLSGQPFIIFWGIPDSSCSGRPDPGSFGMERDSRVAVFYEDTLGNYPYFVDIDTPINGGLPQHTRLETHLQKMKQDLEEALPAPRYLGLGVLRWGEWVPQWSRSREKQALYVEASKKLLKGFFPNWTPAEVEKWSKVRKIQGGRSKEPLWQEENVFAFDKDQPVSILKRCTVNTCPCQEETWKRSFDHHKMTPFISVKSVCIMLFLSSQIKEALRISSASGAEFDLPVFPLVKSVYASTNTFLSQADLVSSIGESAAMGTAGVVMWERSETKTEFVRKVLGPYSINVTTAARLCSASLCQGRGRCVRQNPESSAYLHLPPPSTVAEKVRKYYLKPFKLQLPALWRRCQGLLVSSESACFWGGKKK